MKRNAAKTHPFWSIACCFLCSAISLAQTPITPSASTLTPLAGEWTGTYKFVDTYDDTTIAAKEVMWEIALNDSGVTLSPVTTGLFGWATTVGAGKPLALSADGRKFYLDEQWWHISTARETPAGTTIVFEGLSTDNDRKAHVRNALYIGVADSMTLTKYVTYSGGGHEFVRHQYRLGRTKE